MGGAFGSVGAPRIAGDSRGSLACTRVIPAPWSRAQSFAEQPHVRVRKGLGGIDRPVSRRVASRRGRCIPRAFDAFLRDLMHPCICYSTGDEGRGRALHNPPPDALH